MSYDFQSDSREYPPKYRAISTTSPNVERFEDFRGAIEYCKTQKDSLIKIQIGDREVCGIRNECGKIYINDVEELTGPELNELLSIPVYHKVAIRALLEKYRDAIAGSDVEDIDFIEKMKKGETLDGKIFIMELWERYWDVKARVRGDAMDGIYLVRERDVYSSQDRNTFNFPP